MRDTVRGVVDGEAGEWMGTVIHVDVIAFYPDDSTADGFAPMYDAIKAIPASDMLKVAGVWEEDMEIGRMADEEELAELLGVAVEEFVGKEDDSDLDDDLDDSDLDDSDLDDSDLDDSDLDDDKI